MVYGRFSQRAQQVIINAQKESANFKHGYIGTEHILLGIVVEEGYSSEILKKNGIKEEEIKKIIEKYLGYGECINMSKEELLLTPRAKRLFDESINEAKKLSNKTVLPEHFLLSLINEEDGVAYTILTNLQLDFISAKEELLLFLADKDLDKEVIRDDRKHKANKTPMLDQYGSDLTREALEGKLDPVIGRDKETKEF